MNISFFLQPKCKVAYIYNDDTIRQGLQKMNYYGYSAIPVLDENEHYVGTITEGDFLWHICRIKQNNAMEVDIKELEKQRVNELYFRRNYPSVNVDTSMEALIERISNQNFCSSCRRQRCIYRNYNKKRCNYIFVYQEEEPVFQKIS